jgi:hypothetical protein
MNSNFVDLELPDMGLPGGVRPIMWSKLPWSKCAELVSRMDLGPVPDGRAGARFWAAGAVVVTNTHGSKKSFEQRSRKLLSPAPPSVSPLTDALRDGVKVCRHSEQRFANCGSDHIPRDWELQLDAWSNGCWTPDWTRVLGGIPPAMNYVDPWLSSFDERGCGQLVPQPRRIAHFYEFRAAIRLLRTVAGKLEKYQPARSPPCFLTL